ARIPLPRGQYKTPAAKRQFFSQVLERVRALPGVVTAAAASSLPPFGGLRTEFDVPGKDHAETWNGLFQLCSADYFATLRIRQLRGRLLTEQDVDEGRKVAVVSQLLADRFFGTDDPIRGTITLKTLATPPSQHARAVPGVPGRGPAFRGRRCRRPRQEPGDPGPAAARGLRPVHDH